MRIIQIVENLDKGAVENWLVNIFLESRHERPDWEWTFYCILGKKGRLDDQVEKAGGKIIYAPHTVSDSIKFLKHLRHTLIKGKYDIIHSHHDYLSGFYVIASLLTPYKKRILHIHNNDRGLPISNPVLNNIGLRLFGFSARMLSDIVIGISRNTLREFTDSTIPKVKDTRVLYYGVDLSLPLFQSRNATVRQELGLLPTDKIILFAGRLNKDKNPFFCFEVFVEMCRIRNDIALLIVGEGGERERIAAATERNGLRDRVFFLGWRNDIKSIMWQSDLFLFPRIEEVMEGLGIVVIESQAAGLPVMISRGVVADAIVIKEMVSVVGLDEGKNRWAERALAILDREVSIERVKANAIMNESPFALRNGCNNLISIYEDSP